MMPVPADGEVLTLDEEEKRIILRTLSITGGNISEAARRLACAPFHASPQDDALRTGHRRTARRWHSRHHRRGIALYGCQKRKFAIAIRQAVQRPCDQIVQGVLRFKAQRKVKEKPAIASKPAASAASAWAARDKKYTEIFGPLFPKGKFTAPDGAVVTPASAQKIPVCIAQLRAAAVPHELGLHHARAFAGLLRRRQAGGD
jgi:hypothetical protein